MSEQRKIERIPKEEIARRKENERSLEVNFMLLLMRKYPDKAKEAVKKLSPQTV